MILGTIKDWIKSYVKENIREWVKDLLEVIIARIEAHEKELNQVNTKLDNDYVLLSELAGPDYPAQAAAQRAAESEKSDTFMATNAESDRIVETNAKE